MNIASQTGTQLNFVPGDRSLLQLDSDPSQIQRDSFTESLNECSHYRNITIHQLFEQQVKQTPDATAIAFEQNHLTYQELDQRANQLAHYLRALGVSPDVLVGICVERSLEMVIGLLGILKAGGAYVPLDPAFPQERLAFMLEDAQPPILLTQASRVQSLPSHQAQVICLDTDWKTIAQDNTIAPHAEARSHDLAYVIYTSGSTGKPKGVQIQHGSVVNFLTSMSQQPGLSGEDVLLAVTTLSFDIAVLELFLPLTVGARVVIASREIAADGRRLSALFAASGATVMQATPATWRLLLKAGWQGNRTLKILCGGEALPRELANQLLERSGSVWNMYGPTETTIWSTLCQVFPGENTISVGQAIANTQLYLLDAQLQPVAAGEIGELYIGGAGLARGYLNRAELTHERFIPNPFWQQAEFGTTSDRLYKTGDLARCLPNGNLECLGRIDHQVKIRGYRIELGEIEAVLWQYAAIHELVVVVREDVPGDQRLVAYVVLKPEAQSANQLQRIVVAELRHLLQQKLPTYMVPSSFVIIAALPLTPNGKIDRRALPVPDRTHLATKEFVAPCTPLQQTLACIWAEVLNLEQISLDDNFLELGGHSLLATQVISRIRDALQIELPLRCLFEAPTIAALAERIELAVATDQSQFVGAIEPGQHSPTVPLSCMQEQLWFLDQLVPQHPFYNVPEAVCLVGLLNVQVLEQSLHEIVRRHEALRTTFAVQAGNPVQIIHAAATVQLSVIDLQHLPESERDEQAQQQLTLAAQQPFDLTHDALIRSTLIQLSESQYILLLNLHHTICDEWSFGILWQELATLYTAFVQEQASPLPMPTLQYADFAIWQRQWLQGSVYDRQLAYWKQQLQGHLPILQLPTDYSRPAIPTYAGARHVLTLSASLTEKLHQLSRGEGVTLFMTLLAAFQTLLFRYTAQEDMLIGSPIANRHRSEVEGTIGFFVNTLVFRTDLSGSPSFLALLRRVREVALDAYAHQDLPFEQLVQALQLDRTLNQNPLFQVMFNLQNIPLPTSEIPDLSLTRVSIDNKTAKFDLFLELTETSTGIAGYFEYSTDLFKAATIARLVEQFQTLLEGIVTNPHQTIAALPLLPQAEQAQLSRWHDTQAEYPQQCVHQLVEVQVERTPAEIAVVFEAQQLTYQELNDRANQLAHYLQSLGVCADVPVGLCVERSLDLIIGVLGILKAGGAYVPLEPAYPQERLTFMLENAGVSILVTQQPLVDKIPGDAMTRICLDSDWETIARHNTETPNSDVTLDHLAYVIYTSGSTGKPKGVAMPHRPLTNLLTWQIENSTLTAARTLQFTPISFDVSFQEIFATLGAGGTLILIADDTRRDAVQLLRVLQERTVERLFLPFVALQHLAEVAESERIAPSHLREVITAGEQLRITPAIVHWFSQLHHCTLHNHYGPSESHVVTAFTLTGSPQDWTTLPPIGQAIANTQIHLLDAQRQPVPIGVAGELYIGGVSLARGYLNRPELTAERFILHPPSLIPHPSSSIPHPSSLIPQSRLYKTGDLARYLPDGNIEYLGRIDQQVKIRGFRIELGEVEVALERHPAVREAVAIAREDNPGEKRLVAYIVLQATADESQEPGALRRFLQTQLPEYMVPTAFVFLDQLPLTPSGKVDRRSLPVPNYNRSSVEQTFAAPRTAIEQQLTDLWTQVLKVDPIGIYDNFFELGGHSLLGTLLVVKIRETFGVKLSLRRFFEIPTIAGLAQLIESTQHSAASQLVKNSAIDLEAEAVLDPAIQTNGLPAPISEPAAILLTGATGFLGAFLLYELLQQTQADIYCLVRAATEEAGQKRLQANLERYSLWQEQHRSRIIPVIGDLAKPHFALSPRQFHVLACTIDVIYHNGGSVNFLYPYAVMKAPNVLGSQEVLRLASQHAIKPVHFVSTAGVFSPIDYADRATICEQDEPDRTQGLYGYTQSKWVAEKLMVTARSRGIPTSIYRPFWIEGHSQTGVGNSTDFLRSLIKGCIQLGIVPAWEMRVDMLPADYLSQAIVHLSRQETASGRVFHFSNPHSISWQQLVDWMRHFGYSLQSMPYEQWVATVIAYAANDPENALYPFLTFFSEQLLESGMSVPDIYFKATPLKFACENTVTGLAGTLITCPPVDDQLLATYFSFWIDSGFLKSP